MKDITGVQFGRLTAIAPTDRISRDGSRFWLCRCRCGASTAASLGALESGETESCGCTDPGRKSGWLTLVGRAGGQYRCRCACGRELLVDRQSWGQLQSCGCERKSRAEFDGQMSFFPEENALPYEW